MKQCKQLFKKSKRQWIMAGMQANACDGSTKSLLPQNQSFLPPEKVQNIINPNSGFDAEKI
jgi:hypothetical protein